MTTKKIIVRHRFSNTGYPYFILDSLPEKLCGEDVELFPHEARAYAHALLQAADDCESVEFGHKKPNVLEIRMAYDFK